MAGTANPSHRNHGLLLNPTAEATPTTSKQTFKEALNVLKQRMNDHRPQELISELCRVYPYCFSEVDPQPIQVGIHKEIIKCFKNKGVSSQRVRQALHYYTNSMQYLKSFTTHNFRIDLNGARSGKITPEHKVIAKHELERRRDLNKAKSEKTLKSGNSTRDTPDDYQTIKQIRIS